MEKKGGKNNRITRRRVFGRARSRFLLLRNFFRADARTQSNTPASLQNV